MITTEAITELAALARLRLEEGEAESLGKDISNILDYVKQVEAVPQATSGAPEPVPDVPYNVLRSDTLRDSNDILSGTEETLRHAFPKREGNFNVVRKIIQKDE